jgi:hypothetical protein
LRTRTGTVRQGDFDLRDARKIAPTILGHLYLIQAQMAPRTTRTPPSSRTRLDDASRIDVRLRAWSRSRFDAGGKVDQGLAILERSAHHSDDPDAVVALAQAYMDANRAPTGGEVAAGGADEISRRSDRGARAWAP